LEWDHGQVNITVNGFLDQTGFDAGSPCCQFFIAQYLRNTINIDNPYVTATWDGSYTITLTAKTVGSSTNYSLSAGATYWADCSYYDANNVLQSPCFTQPSFTATASGAALTGGRNTVYDTGTVSITVNGHSDNCPNYGQGSTTSSIASNCANTINGDAGAPATASASGGVLTLTAKQAGLTGNSYSLSVSIASSNGFSPPSFSASNPASLSGGH
jgi:phage tail sheath gpL-like